MLKLVFFLLLYSVTSVDLFAISKLDFRILQFEIEGLKLTMSLDKAQKKNNFKKIKPIKDSDGVISGYEVNIVNQDKRVSIYFTSEKRLYKIHYYNRYLRYEGRGMELLEQIKRKYGPPSSTGRSDSTIFACWGTPCKRFSPKSPYLRATVIPLTGKIELNLYHKGILLKDWGQYRRKTSKLKNQLGNKGFNEDDPKLDF